MIGTFVGRRRIAAAFVRAGSEVRRGSGAGFFNTRHRYVGKHTFVVTE